MAAGEPANNTGIGADSPRGIYRSYPRRLFYRVSRTVPSEDQPGVVLLDTRPPAAYAGQASWAKPGHIPGAINIPAQVLADEKNVALIKSPDDLREIFVSRGVTPDKTVICSCGTGRAATLVFLVLKWYLSYPRVVMYEGGFTEWISYPENPVEVGNKKDV